MWLCVDRCDVASAVAVAWAPLVALVAVAAVPLLVVVVTVCVVGDPALALAVTFDVCVVADAVACAHAEPAEALALAVAARLIDGEARSMRTRKSAGIEFLLPPPGNAWLQSNKCLRAASILNTATEVSSVHDQATTVVDEPQLGWRNWCCGTHDVV